MFFRLNDDGGTVQQFEPRGRRPETDNSPAGDAGMTMARKAAEQSRVTSCRQIMFYVSYRWSLTLAPVWQ